MGFYQWIENNFGRRTKRLFKQYNNALTSKTKLECSRSFLIECRKRKIVPRFISDRSRKLFTTPERIKMPQQLLDNFIYRTNRIQLNIHISDSYRQIHHQQKYLLHLRIQIDQQVPQHITNEFVNRQKKAKFNAKQNQKKRTAQKLEKLTKQQVIKINYQSDWFINLTSKIIPKEAETILALGPKFAVNQNKQNLPIFNIIADIENLTHKISEVDKQQQFRSKATTILSNHLKTVNSKIKPNDQYLLTCYKHTQRFLRENPQLLLLEADKGSTTIAMEKTTYDAKMNAVFEDRSKYRLLSDDPTKKLQTQNNSLVSTLLHNKHINKKQRMKLNTYTAQAPKPYGVIKLHKPDNPIRIIFPSVNSPAYHLNELINNICKQLSPNLQFNIKNSYQLKQLLNTIKITDDDMISSLDVVSMYERIPIRLVYQAIRKRRKDLEKITSIPIQLFLDIIKFCIDDTNYLQFRNKFYKAKNGLAIGGCASPILADMVMTDIIEEAVLELGYDPILLVKYVDDILLIGPKEEMENTFNIFNQINQSIKFTIEHECNHQINYLDITIIREADGRISTNFYQKPTNKGRILNYNSSHPSHQKLNTAQNLINRIFTLSSEKYWKNNIPIAIDLLVKNSYPKTLINSIITKFLRDSKNANILSEDKNNTNTHQPKPQKQYISCNYINGLSEKIQKQYTKINPQYTIAHKSSNNIKKTHNAKKDIISKMKKSELIYQMDCKDCDKIYIGQTGQFLGSRMYQHKADYNKRHLLKNKHKTSATQHSILTDHQFNYDNPSIIHMEQQKSKRNTLEMIYITKEREKVVNVKSETEKLSSTYQQLIDQPNV